MGDLKVVIEDARRRHSPLSAAQWGLWVARRALAAEKRAEGMETALRRLKLEVDFIEPRNKCLEAAFVAACGVLGEPVPGQGGP